MARAHDLRRSRMLGCCHSFCTADLGMKHTGAILPSVWSVESEALPNGWGSDEPLCQVVVIGWATELGRELTRRMQSAGIDVVRGVFGAPIDGFIPIIAHASLINLDECRKELLTARQVYPASPVIYAREVHSMTEIHTSALHEPESKWLAAILAQLGYSSVTKLVPV